MFNPYSAKYMSAHIDHTCPLCISRTYRHVHICARACICTHAWRVSTACYCRSGHMPELLPNLPTFCQLACRISAIAGQFACQYGSHEVTGGTSRAMACCFTCDSTRHCMPMRCMHDDPPRPWHAVLHVVPRCSFLTHTSIILLPPRLEHPESGMENVVLWHVLLRACFSHTSPPLRPLLHPSAPRRGVESLLRQRVARHAATHHAAGRQTQGIVTHTSITPFPYQTAASRVRHAKSSAMAYRFVCLLASHTSPPLRHTQALLVQGSKTSSSARHAATHHAAGRQTQVFLAQTPITPLPYHARASRV